MGWSAVSVVILGEVAYKVYRRLGKSLGYCSSSPPCLVPEPLILIFELWEHKRSELGETVRVVRRCFLPVSREPGTRVGGAQGTNFGLQASTYVSMYIRTVKA